MIEEMSPTKLVPLIPNCIEKMPQSWQTARRKALEKV